jgi:LPPG:FO 2-phospho-L-lactate transferase
MLVALTGGTGGAKLIHGLSYEIRPEELTIVCNTADDFVLYGLNISPDLDTIMYTLAGLSDDVKSWGVRGDMFRALEQFQQYGYETWFKLGDRDLATHIIRTKLLRDGFTLSQVTEQLSHALGIHASILPMSDQRVETRVTTSDGEISFQEYFVKQRWQPEVRRVVYWGIEATQPAPRVIEAIRDASAVILCPSNPITSIGPILAIPGIRDAIKGTAAPVVGVSPIIGASAISGPAHKLMAAQGQEASVYGVAKGYADLLDWFFIETEDARHQDSIEGLGIKTVTTSIRIGSLAERRRLTRELLAFVKK